MNQTISYYDEHAEEYCAATVNADMSYCRNRFIAYLPVGAHILDAGCGSGRDSKVFLEKGFTVTAVDASEKMCKEAEKLLGQDVIQCTFQKMNFQNAFDGIWACASLLHVEKNEINSVMYNLKRALKPGGVLYVSFKYGTEERTLKGRLFSNYTEGSLTALLMACGFLIIDVFITEDVREAGRGEKWVNAIARML